MSEKLEQYLQSLVQVLPNKPGVYQYFDKEGTIIYVGKAKDLKKRVSSYFVKNHESAKTRILVRITSYNVCYTKLLRVIPEMITVLKYGEGYPTWISAGKPPPSSISVSTWDS